MPLDDAVGTIVLGADALRTEVTASRDLVPAQWYAAGRDPVGGCVGLPAQVAAGVAPGSSRATRLW